MLGSVMHKRLTPKVNAFNYGIYYLVLPLKSLNALPIAHNKFGLLSFYDKDHGARDGSDLNAWIRNILHKASIDEADGNITLITMPRVLGYVFNPVSFWFCHDKAGQVRAVLCEVNNTFGESHIYICIHPDRRPLTSADWIEGDKYFHVSPFLHVQGKYVFRFDLNDKSLHAWIDYWEAENHKKLLTALQGTMVPMTTYNLHMVFWRYPLVTFKAILLIHWQAIKLLAKGIRYIPKPLQQNPRLTIVNKITKM
jgi:DUF1365 family protein